jgi:hypothetical protein
LSFPVGDLYPEGQPAGQVGQEIYGAGAAMVFATRAFHKIEGAPFMIFCDHFLRAFTRFDSMTASFRVEGEASTKADAPFYRERALAAARKTGLGTWVIRQARSASPEARMK